MIPESLPRDPLVCSCGKSKQAGQILCPACLRDIDNLEPPTREPTGLADDEQEGKA